MRLYLFHDSRLQGFLVKREAGLTYTAITDQFIGLTQVRLNTINQTHGFLINEQAHPEGSVLTLYDFFEQDSSAAKAYLKTKYDPLTIRHYRIKPWPYEFLKGYTPISPSDVVIKSL